MYLLTLVGRESSERYKIPFDSSPDPAPGDHMRNPRQPSPSASGFVSSLNTIGVKRKGIISKKPCNGSEAAWMQLSTKHGPMINWTDLFTQPEMFDITKEMG
mmetsp:Transcript_20000/g.32536  ORF Transcript_20000/g.32536 Transcript_20000/m.32536 type:complete len:102 (+) Transcript_20000:306-611(+)